MRHSENSLSGTGATPSQSVMTNSTGARRMISEQAEVVESPIQTATELRTWLMDFEQKNRKHYEKNRKHYEKSTGNKQRYEKRLEKELSFVMSRENAADAAHSYLRVLSDRAEVLEAPIDSVSDRVQWLSDFGKRQREHSELYDSSKKPDPQSLRGGGRRRQHSARHGAKHGMFERSDSQGTRESSSIVTGVNRRAFGGGSVITSATDRSAAATSQVRDDESVQYTRKINERAEEVAAPHQPVSDLKTWLVGFGQTNREHYNGRYSPTSHAANSVASRRSQRAGPAEAVSDSDDKVCHDERDCGEQTGDEDAGERTASEFSVEIEALPEQQESCETEVVDSMIELEVVNDNVVEEDQYGGEDGVSSADLITPVSEQTVDEAANNEQDDDSIHAGSPSQVPENTPKENDEQFHMVEATSQEEQQSTQSDEGDDSIGRQEKSVKGAEEYEEREQSRSCALDDTKTKGNLTQEEDHEQRVAERQTETARDGVPVSSGALISNETRNVETDANEADMSQQEDPVTVTRERPAVTVDAFEKEEKSKGFKGLLKKLGCAANPLQVFKGGQKNEPRAQFKKEGKGFATTGKEDEEEYPSLPEEQVLTMASSGDNDDQYVVCGDDMRSPAMSTLGLRGAGDVKSEGFTVMSSAIDGASVFSPHADGISSRVLRVGEETKMAGEQVHSRQSQRAGLSKTMLADHAAGLASGGAGAELVPVHQQWDQSSVMSMDSQLDADVPFPNKLVSLEALDPKGECCGDSHVKWLQTAFQVEAP